VNVLLEGARNFAILYLIAGVAFIGWLVTAARVASGRWSAIAWNDEDHTNAVITVFLWLLSIMLWPFIMLDFINFVRDRKDRY
jgi:hypothetical protein